MKAPAALLLAAAVAAGVAAGGGTARGSAPRITVFAAASLTNVLPKIDPKPTYSFAGSNTLATQIEQGAPADVFASADLALPQRLHRKHLCSRAVVFTRNQLVVVLPRSNPAHLHTVRGLARHGVKVVVADESVPVGAYTVKVLRKLHLLRAVSRNVVSKETDVREVLAKVVLGEADAGFVYRTDAKVDAGKVKTLRIPSRAQPTIKYGLCVVSGTGRLEQATAFRKRVLSRAGQRKLRAAGFLLRKAR